MSRLTKNVLYFENSQSVNDKKLCVKVFNKLSNLEFLEDELGCTLEVVFKALKKGILVDNKTRWYPTVSLEKINLDDTWCFLGGCYLYDLKDYQKTWWLTGDLEVLNNDNNL